MSVRYKSSSELIPTKSNKTFLAFTLLGLETDRKLYFASSVRFTCLITSLAKET